jgi:hypothetical protein
VGRRRTGTRVCVGIGSPANLGTRLRPHHSRAMIGENGPAFNRGDPPMPEPGNPVLTGRWQPTAPWVLPPGGRDIASGVAQPPVGRASRPPDTEQAHDGHER